MEEMFTVNEDQRAILKTVARFNEDEVKPRAAALDANTDPERCFSWEIVEKAHELGLRTLTLAERWGGLGADSAFGARLGLHAVGGKDPVQGGRDGAAFFSCQV